MITSPSYSYRGNIQHTSIIKAIRSSELQNVKSIVSSFPDAVNEIDPETGKNAAMLAAAGILPRYVEVILSQSEHLDFEHVDNFGNNLIVNAQIFVREIMWEVAK